MTILYIRAGVGVITMDPERIELPVVGLWPTPILEASHLSNNCDTFVH
jgi:hypothetical protein